MLSATILQAFEERAVAAPPPGFSAAFVRYFFQSERAALLAILRPLDALAEEREAEEGDGPQDLEKGKARTEANLAAMALVAEAKRQGRALSEDERQVVRAYSGWGGLSIEKNLARMPDGFKAQAQGLIHEFYTPTALAEEIARVLRPLLPGLETSGVVRALEPAAGIGRFVHALAAPQVRWQAVELSPVSSQLLQATVPPGSQIFAGSFEEYVTNHPEVDGQVDLVVSNPPYGARGGTVGKDRAYLQQDRAYFYFLERALGLLRAGGLGAFVVPYGFLTSRAKAYRDFRSQILLRHHLAAAFRLPADVFSGVHLVTDILFFRARGGTLRTPSPADAEVQDGRYYQMHPDHILGVEVRTNEDDGDKSAVQRFEEQLANPTGKRPRFGYDVMRRRTVAGELLPLRLPDVLPERPLCFECPIIPAERASAPVVLLTAEIEAAARLGRRIAALSALLARGDDASKADAEALHRELLPSLDGFTGHYGSPWARKDLVAATSSPKVGDAVLTFLNAFDKRTGELVPSLRTLPPFTPRFRGEAADIDGQARWLYAQTGTVTADSLLSFHRQAGGTLGADALLRALLDEEWAWDRGELFPPEVYYSGYLWPKLDRARSYPDNPDYERQVGKLLDAIKPATFDQIFLSLRSTWVPIEIVRDFVAALFRQPMPPLERVGDQITLPGVDPIILSLGEMDTYQAKGGARYELTQDLLTFLGYMNNDLQLFRPPVGDGKKLDDARAEFALAVNKQWSKFLDDRADLRAKLTELYNRLYRGYVAPSYAREPLSLARWGKTIKLNPWQDEAAQALTAKRRGLLCFTVGVGKTFTGCAIIAKARQAGWSVRPVVVVPNNLLWNWYLSFGLALPDYSVGIIGAERYVGKDGKARERTDTPQERAAKWQAFQRGEYDVMLVTYSMLRRSKLSNNMDLTVAELVALDENLQAQLRDQGKSRLKNQVRQEQSRDKLLLARATLLRDLAAKVGFYERDGSYLLYDNLNDVPDVTLPTRGEAERVRRERVLQGVRATIAEAEAEKAAKAAARRKTPKKTEKEDKPQEDVLDALWKRVLIDAGFLSVSSLTDQQLAEEEAIRERQKTSMSERARAVLQEARYAFAARFIEPRPNEVLDPGIAWDELGIDLLLIDEIQNFKNRDTIDKTAFNYKYLGAVAQGSSLAWQLFFRAAVVRKYTGSLVQRPLVLAEEGGRWKLREGEVLIGEFDQEDTARAAKQGQEVGRALAGGGGIFGLSGTPVKNSPLELYVQMTYVAPELLRRVGVSTVTAFLIRYLDTERRTVLTPTQELVEVTAVVGFVQLDELRDLFYSIGIYKTPKDVGLKVPDARNNTIAVKKTELQAEKYRAYSFLYKTQAFRPYQLGLQIRMQLVGIHPELDGALIEDLRGMVAVIQELRLLKDKDPLRTKALQEDLSRRMKAFFARDRYDDLEEGEQDPEEDEDAAPAEDKDDWQPWGWDNADEIANPHSPKLDACADQIVAAPACGHIVFVDNLAAHKWMRRVLVARGIPSERIAILNARVGGLKVREEIALGFTGRDEKLDDRGNVVLSALPRRYDVLIANRVANEGLNLQRQTCQLHHLDLPWEGATLEQRNGRGVRQGNEFAEVVINYYLVTASMDSVRLQQVIGKQSWADAIFRSGVSVLRNPLADRESDAEIFMAEDPEAAQAAAAEKKRKLLMDAAATRAWGWLNKLYLRARDVASGVADVTEADVAGLRELLRTGSTRQDGPSPVPMEVAWPYGWLVPIIEAAGRAKKRAVFFTPGVLWEGAQWVGGDVDASDWSGRPFEVCRIADAFGTGVNIILRSLGEIGTRVVSQAHARDELWAGREALGWQTPWPVAADRERMAVEADQWLSNLQYGPSYYYDAHLEHTSDEHRAYVWSRWGVDIVKALRKAGQNHSIVQLPALGADGKLFVLSGAALRFVGDNVARVLPPTRAGYEAFLKAAAEDGPAIAPGASEPDGWTFTTLEQCAKNWWGERIPRDLLSAARKRREEEAATHVFGVRLLKVGSNQLQVLQVLQTAAAIDLQGAFGIVQLAAATGPTTVKEKLAQRAAVALVEALRQAGAEAEVIAPAAGAQAA